MASSPTSSSQNKYIVQCLSLMIFVDWGKLGKLFEEKRKKRWLQAQKRAKTAIFREVNLPLTPSFVGSNPATPATDTIYCIRNVLPNTIYGFCFFCGFFLPFDCGVNCGVIAG